MWNFSRNTKGNVALLFAGTLLPVSLAVGCAIDYGTAIKIKSELQLSSDVAAAAAVNDPSNRATAAGLKTAAENNFTVNAAANLKGLPYSFTIATAIDADTRKRTSTVNFQADVPTSFLRIIGIPAIPVAGSSKAQSGVPAQIDFYFLADTSDSMGLAATDDSRTRLIALSNANGTGNCEFACHVQRGGRDSLLNVARANNVRLRIDVARDGMKKIVDLASAAEAEGTTDYRFALTSFNSGLNTLSDLSEDMAAVKSRIDQVDIGYGAGPALANTLWEATSPRYLRELDRLTTAGNRPKADRIVFLVTDGLRSQDGGSGRDGNGRPLIRPVDLDQCTAMKSAGYKVAVVYTKYYRIPYNAWYNTYVDPIYTSIETNLRNCATTGMFAVGDTPAEIDAAFSKIFEQINEPVHLTD